MKPMYFIIPTILIAVAGIAGLFLIYLKNQDPTRKQPIGTAPIKQTGQQQKLLELSISPYGPGNSDPPEVRTQTTLYLSGIMENQRTSYKQDGSSYKPITTATTSTLRAEVVTKIEEVVKQLIGKDCTKQGSNRSIKLSIYWQNQTKTIESPNYEKEITEIRRLLSQ